ncbi:MAG: hypothetical protein HYZ27_09245 [Deltaproteobacteria bacterium]|nr:hypothetical protein [Deltaproteobacteria bacterium]
MKARNSLLCALALAGCGNLSNDDLIFLAGIPRPAEVALDVQDSGAGALTQALGEEAELYRGARSIAAGVNGGVEGLLRFVDSLGRGYPPTERTDDTRVWGPVSNVDGKHFTLRLEIKREENAAGGARFSFCLQVAPDSAYTGDDATCGDLGTSGLKNVLYGHYDPRRGGGARSGSGQIFLDFEALVAGGGEERGFFALDYDFSDGGIEKQIHIDWTGPLGGMLAYDYGRTADGHVDFSFEITAVNTGTTGNDPESWSINAFWDENAGGRADALGRGGDLEPDQFATATECWDAGHRRTYWRVVIWRGTVEEAVLADEGSVADCP